MTGGRRAQSTGEAGVAAIEFAIVLPVLLLLFFGMINFTSYISMLRKASSAAELVADLVTRNDATVRSVDIDDYIEGANLSFLPSAPDDVNVSVYNYFNVGTTAQARWQWPETGSACTAPLPTSPEIAALLSGGDVIVAVVCIPGYDMPISFPGIPELGAIQKSIALRPRHSTTLVLQKSP